MKFKNTFARHPTNAFANGSSYRLLGQGFVGKIDRSLFTSRGYVLLMYSFNLSLPSFEQCSLVDFGGFLVVNFKNLKT